MNKPEKDPVGDGDALSNPKQNDLRTTVALDGPSRHAKPIQILSGGIAGKEVNYLGVVQMVEDTCRNVREGNLDELTDMLTGQALHLDSMFAEYSRTALGYLNKWPEAFDRYARLAAKAQNQCRTTVETLVRLNVAASSR